MIISISVCRSRHGGFYYHVHCECYCILSFVTAINQPYCPFSVMSTIKVHQGLWRNHKKAII